MPHPPPLTTLQSLKEQQLIWQGRRLSEQKPACLASGYAAFDHALSGGWPASGLVELTPVHLGIGELRLLLPVVTELAGTRPLQAWVGAPACLTPHNLSVTSLERCLLIWPKRQQMHWVLEQLLASACCSTVVCWMDELSLAQARRLQVIAKESGTLVFVIRQQPDVSQSLPVSLRLHLGVVDNGLKVVVLKRQNGWPVAPFEVDLSDRFPQLIERKRREIVARQPDNVLSFPVCREPRGE
ncbi:MAG: recombinase RecA [Oleiphilus sp.]|nr:MAG: recombinase RecA [Oleiphilus sp.]